MEKNVDKCRCECKKRHVCEKDYIWNPDTCSSENRKYLASITDGSAIAWDEIMESYEEKLLIAIALLIAVSIYCYLIKYRAKQKHALPFNNINNKLKEVNNINKI